MQVRLLYLHNQYLIYNMKTLSNISYVLGAILLIISCFVTTIATTWWLGGIAIILLIVGAVFQYNYKKKEIDETIKHERNLR